jgi:hypothetical protein
MQRLRPIAALLAIAAVTVACSGPPGSSSGGESSQGGAASQAASQPASSSGGGGGGANGSVTYEIKGDYESAGGWVANFANQSGEGAVILINTQAAEGTTGQIFTFGDGTVTMAAASGDTGFDCTFTLTKNDSSGLVGDLKCTNALAIDNNSGAQKHVEVTAHWDAHP